MTYSALRKLFFSVFLLLLSTQSVLAVVESAEPKWKLEKEKSGVQIYTGNNEGSGLVTYKAVTEVNTRLSNLFNFLQDVNVTTSWLYNLKSIVRLGTRYFYEADYYVIYSTPWPVSDVSAVLRATWQYDQANKLLKNSTVSVDTEQFRDDGYMHIPLIETHNRFQQIGNDKVKLSFQVTIDHGYAVPDLIVDSVSIDTLYETLINLQGVDYMKYGDTNLLNELLHDK